MHLAKHKRIKFHNEGTDFSFMSKNAVLADHGNTEERTPAKIVDYSDAFTFSSILQDEGKYGSFTKNYEAIHAQRMHVLNLILAQQPSFSSPHSKHGNFAQTGKVTPSDPSNCCKEVNPDQYTRNPVPQGVIDLDADNVVNGADSGISHGQQICRVSSEGPKRKGDDIMSAITLDSDEEDGGSHLQNKQPSTSVEARNFHACLVSQIQQQLGRNTLSIWKGHANCQMSYDQGNSKLDCDVALEGKKFPSIQYEKVVLKTPTERPPIPNIESIKLTEHVSGGSSLRRSEIQMPRVRRGEKQREALDSEGNAKKGPDADFLPVSSEIIPDYSPGLGTPDQDGTKSSESDGLEDLWKDMSIAMECSKGTVPSDESAPVEEDEECSHSFKLEDDLGLVCRVCGVIQKSIDTIFDYQWMKGTRSTRTYLPGSRSANVDEMAQGSGPIVSEQFLIAADISIHPRHMKQMKPHQIEGFNFLVKNLLADPPGGCILAHAPGSGKTFMLISFIQSFMAKDPHARPLVVLPKGILAIWKKEFQRWQVEDIPLYDFYSAKADNRAQQLEVLNSWHLNRSILLLGYKQFANIICEATGNKVTALCQEKLLKVPTLLILDEGHTPRNDSTDMVTSLGKVRTPCKVVLSGTLFQNHVGEVFNILKLVRPNFMKMESSRAVIKRVRSRVPILGGKRPNKANKEGFFYDLVEQTLRRDGEYKWKVVVIQELREMTRDVLHYYKGDFLEELPGLIDFTVFLNLGARQKDTIRKLGKLDKFKKSSVEKAIYMHPQLSELRDNASGDKDTSINIQKLDTIIDSLNIREGIKAKFFLNLLSMAESSGEKLLVFSQYILPLKFLERLIVRLKGWSPGKEIFVISGDTSPEDREWSMEQFNSSPHAKVFFGSIKACGEGISLVGASRILILDVHLNPSVTRQAVGRAFRPGQEKKVYVYRLVAADSQEEEDHNTAFTKELISKMWFEWSQYCGHGDFDLDAVDVAESQDIFLDHPALREDIKALYRRW